MRFGKKKFKTKVLVLNNNKEVKNMDELVDACIDYV